jgi:hypothetical protein
MEGMRIKRQLLFGLQPFRSILANSVGPAKRTGRFSKAATHPFDPQRPVGLTAPCLGFSAEAGDQRKTGAPVIVLVFRAGSAKAGLSPACLDRRQRRHVDDPKRPVTLFDQTAMLPPPQHLHQGRSGQPDHGRQFVLRDWHLGAFEA